MHQPFAQVRTRSTSNPWLRYTGHTTIGETTLGYDRQEKATLDLGIQDMQKSVKQPLATVGR